MTFSREAPGSQFPGPGSRVLNMVTFTDAGGDGLAQNATAPQRLGFLFGGRTHAGRACYLITCLPVTQ